MPNPQPPAQEDFKLVCNALENRMATLCRSISEQEALIQELQAEEQRRRDANQAVMVCVRRASRLRHGGGGRA